MNHDSNINEAILYTGTIKDLQQRDDLICMKCGHIAATHIHISVRAQWILQWCWVVTNQQECYCEQFVLYPPNWYIPE